MADEEREELMGLVGLGRPNLRQELPPEQHKTDPEDTQPVAGRRGVRTRPEALRKRQEILGGREAGKQETAQKANVVAGYAALQRTPHVAVRSDGIFLNRAQVAKLVTGESALPANIPLAARILGAHGGFPGWDCYRAEDVIDWLNSGGAGTASMGKLELVDVRTIADLDGAAGGLIGYLSPDLQRAGWAVMPGTSVGIESHFGGGNLFGAHSPPPGKDGEPLSEEALAKWRDALPEDCFTAHALAAWRAVDGRPRKGWLTDLRQCVPFQALMVWASTSTGSPFRILAVRSLKYESGVSDQVAGNSAPFELTINAGTGELLKAVGLPCGETWRPRVADVGVFVIAVDPVSMKVLYIRPYAPAPEEAAELPAAPPLADTANRFMAEHADDPALLHPEDFEPATHSNPNPAMPEIEFKDGEEETGG